MRIKVVWAPPYFYGKYGNRCTYEQNIQCANELVGNGMSVTKYGPNRQKGVGTGALEKSKFAQKYGFWPPEADTINIFR